THPHKVVLQGEGWSAAFADDVLPSAVGEISMISAGYQLGTVGEGDSVRRFDRLPVSYDHRLDVVTVGPPHLRSVYLVADLKISERPMAAVGQQDRRVPDLAVGAGVTA